MSPWRRTASQPAQDALDALREAALDLATGVLQDHGVLWPFAVSLDDEEEMAVTGTDPGEPVGPGGRERPATQVVDEAVHGLVRGLRDERDELVAVAVVCQVRLVDGTDAVRVDLEHREGTAISVVAPHRRRRLSRVVVLGEATTVADDARVWADLPPHG